MVESDEMIHTEWSDIALCLDESYGRGASHRWRHREYQVKTQRRSKLQEYSIMEVGMRLRSQLTQPMLCNRSTLLHHSKEDARILAERSDREDITYQAIASFPGRRRNGLATSASSNCIRM